MALRNLLVRIGADLSGLQKGMKQAQSQINTFGKNVKGTMGKVSAVLAAVGGTLALGSAINDAIKYEALMGTIGETLGSTANDFVKWSETVGAAMGFSKLASAEMANTFSLKFKGIAKDAQDNFRMTTDLMKAAAIVRTKTGMAEVEIMDRMRSAMNQEADGADELGVNVRVAAITASNAYKQMANGVPWAELSKNQQTLILQAHITESIYSKLGNTVANNTALLKGNFLAALADTKLALGQAFLPILNIALPLLTALTRKVESAFKFFAGFMRALFPKSNIAAGSAQVKSTDKQTSSLGKQKGAVDGLTNSVKNLGKAKKKASNGVAGFDEVNTLASSASADDGSVGGGGSGDVLSGIGDEAVSAQTSVDNLGDSIFKVSEKVKEWADKFKDWLKPIKPYWDDLVEAVKNVYDAISDVWNSPDGKKLKEWLTSGWDLGISGLLEIFAGLYDTLAGVFRIIWGLLTGDWKLMWEGAGDIIKGLIEILNGTFGPLFPDLMKKVKEFTDDFKTKWNALLDINYLEIGVEVLKAFVQMKNDIAKVWDDVTTAAGTAANDIWSAIQSKFTTVKTWFTTKFGDIASALGSKATDVGTKAGEVWNKVKGAFGSVWATVKANTIDKITSGFGDSKTLKSVGDAAKKVWDTIKSKFGSFTVSIGTSFASSVKGIINSVISKINSFLGKLRDILQSIDKYVPGNIFKPSQIPNIPYLAKGGIIDSPTMAMVGEAGKEAVMPLENNTGWINELASKLNGMGGGGNNGPIEVTLQLNETKLGKVAISSINKVHRQSGKILLNL